MTIPQRPSGAPALRAATTAPAVRRSDKELFPVYPTFGHKQPVCFISYNALVDRVSAPTVSPKASSSASTPYKSTSGKTHAAASHRDTSFNAVIIDHDDGDYSLDDIKGLYGPYSVPLAIYSTASHLQGADPSRKWRVVIPLACGIKADQFLPLARGAAELFGADDAQARLNQIFFLPNKIADDAPYEFSVRPAGQELPFLDPTDESHPFCLAALAAYGKVVAREEAQLAEAMSAPSRPRSANVDAGIVQLYNDSHSVEELLTAAGYRSNGKGSFRAPQSKSKMYGVNILSSDGHTRCFSHHGSHDPLSKLHGKTAYDAFDLHVVFEHGGDFSSAVKTTAEVLDADAQHERQVAFAESKEELETVKINLSLDSINPMRVEPIDLDDAVEKLKRKQLAPTDDGDKEEKIDNSRRRPYDGGEVGSDFDPTADYSWPTMPDGSPNPSGNKFAKYEDFIRYTTLHKEEQLYVSIAKALMRRMVTTDQQVCLLMAVCVLATLNGRKVVGGFGSDRDVTTLDFLILSASGNGKTTISLAVRHLIDSMNSLFPSRVGNGCPVIKFRPQSQQAFYAAFAPYCKEGWSTLSVTEECGSMLKPNPSDKQAEINEYALQLYDGVLEGKLPPLQAVGVNRPEMAHFHTTGLRSTVMDHIGSVVGAGSSSGATNRSIVMLLSQVVACKRDAPPATYTGSIESRRIALAAYDALESTALLLPNWLYERMASLRDGTQYGNMFTPAAPLIAPTHGTLDDRIADTPFKKIINSICDGENELLRRMPKHVVGILTAVAASRVAPVEVEPGIFHAYIPRDEVVFWCNVIRSMCERFTLAATGGVADAIRADSKEETVIIGNIVRIIEKRASNLRPAQQTLWREHGILRLTDLKGQAAVNAFFKMHRDPNKEANDVINAMALDGSVIVRVRPDEAVKLGLNVEAKKPTSFFRVNMEYFE